MARSTAYADGPQTIERNAMRSERSSQVGSGARWEPRIAAFFSMSDDRTARMPRPTIWAIRMEFIARCFVLVLLCTAAQTSPMDVAAVVGRLALAPAIAAKAEELLRTAALREGSTGGVMAPAICVQLAAELLGKPFSRMQAKKCATLACAPSYAAYLAVLRRLRSLLRLNVWTTETLAGTLECPDIAHTASGILKRFVESLSADQRKAAVSTQPVYAAAALALAAHTARARGGKARVSLPRMRALCGFNMPAYHKAVELMTPFAPQVPSPTEATLSSAPKDQVSPKQAKRTAEEWIDERSPNEEEPGLPPPKRSRLLLSRAPGLEETQPVAGSIESKASSSSYEEWKAAMLAAP
eukprot:m.194862 g.194862  ORF g.194862 m.194862 type:complete len:355 (+) comp10624_c0_seq6:1361-2425(+)